MDSRKKIFLILLINLIILVPSLRFFSKFMSIYLGITYIIFGNIFFYFLFVKRIYFQQKIWLFYPFAIGILNYFIYPVIDARRKNGVGSTADDAMFLATKSFFSTGKMYDLFINRGTPISPGPGWIIMNLGIINKLYFCFTPLYLFVLFIIIYKYFDSRFINIFIMIISFSTVFWELNFNGHDIVPFSICFLIFLILVYQNIIRSKNIFGLIIMSFIIGLLSTCRVIFLVYPMIIGSLVFIIHKKKGILLLSISLITNLFLHYYFNDINTFYQPFHLIFKAKNILGKQLIEVLGMIIAIGYCLLLFYLKNNKLLILNSIYMWNYILLIIYSAILLPLSYIALINSNFNFKIWEEANYSIPCLILLSFEMSFSNIKHLKR